MNYPGFYQVPLSPIECSCDNPEFGYEKHELSSSCYVWYKLKVKYRGVTNAGTPIIRAGRGYELGEAPK